MADVCYAVYEDGPLEPRAPRSSARWLHVPATKEVSIVVLSERRVRYRGHWFDGRMRHCVGLPECVPCRYHVGSQERYCYSVWLPFGEPGSNVAVQHQGVRMLLEVGYEAAAEITRLSECAGQLRGLTVRLEKRGGSYRGMLLVSSWDNCLIGDSLPESEDVAFLLQQGWRERDSEE